MDTAFPLVPLVSGLDTENGMVCLLEDELVTLNAAFGWRLGRELAEYLLRLRLVVGDVAPRLRGQNAR